ncbi:helix-turn-helix domain-containing protein [Streptomyces sp. NBC_01237]|uniref:helix-turn-helix domain-containing protein n=1 Tax=Streptomyces sp. NBC_01237 TaxID=2903790 RepID=UPI002DD83E51|nr:helix-turn-helix transcriptional regulator [Streptomyces sp. NBC_01237]WRZ78737.1 helix-turn-helix transcriptional regulator [Streptomyces sp. NBC_01237]
MPKNMSTEDTLRITVAALMRACGETQGDLGHGIRVSQGQVSRKQQGKALWSLSDVDRLCAHYGIPVPDLLAGPTHAVQMLPAARRAALLAGRQEVIRM